MPSVVDVDAVLLEEPGRLALRPLPPNGLAARALARFLAGHDLRVSADPISADLTFRL